MKLLSPGMLIGVTLLLVFCWVAFGHTADLPQPHRQSMRVAP